MSKYFEQIYKVANFHTYMTLLTTRFGTAIHQLRNEWLFQLSCMCGTEGVTKKWKQMEYLLSLSDIPSMAAAINKA